MILKAFAFGDALGFPTECGAAKNVDDLIEWEDPRTGERIKKGEYSDDTQLTLAVARSIWNGEFHPEYFAYVELPLWYYYRRGAGRSTTKAALNLFSPRIQWHQNFYMGYKEAGGSGAAMRVLPIVLAFKDFEIIVRYTLYSSITTHGHPKAILGALLISAAYKAVKDGKENYVVELFGDFYNSSLHMIQNDRYLTEWAKLQSADFLDEYSKEFSKAFEKLRKVLKAPSLEEIYVISGEKETPGSGVSTALCAVGIFNNFKESLKEGIIAAANEKGTDTDTIAAMTSGLFALYSNKIKKVFDLSQVQDATYLDNIERSLENPSNERPFSRQSVRKYAADLEKNLQNKKLPASKHPVFGTLRPVAVTENHIETLTEEGQKVYFKIQ